MSKLTNKIQAYVNKTERPHEETAKKKKFKRGAGGKNDASSVVTAALKAMNEAIRALNAIDEETALTSSQRKEIGAAASDIEDAVTEIFSYRGPSKLGKGWGGPRGS